MSAAEGDPIEVHVISPDRVVFRGEAASIQYPGEDGLYGILPRHAPMITTVDTGVLRLKKEDGSEQGLVLARGFVQVRDNEVRFAVDSGEPVEEIDPERAKQARERARKRLSHEEVPEDFDLKRAEYALKRAIARLKAARKR